MQYEGAYVDWFSNACLSTLTGLLTGFIFFALSNLKSTYKEKTKLELKKAKQTIKFAKRLTYAQMTANPEFVCVFQPSQKQREKVITNDFIYFEENIEMFIKNAYILSRYMPDYIEEAATNLLEETNDSYQFHNEYFSFDNDYALQIMGLYEKLKPICEFCDEAEDILQEQYDIIMTSPI